MDWDNSYYTMTDNNNLHNWFLIKTYFEKDGYTKEKMLFLGVGDAALQVQNMILQQRDTKK